MERSNYARTRGRRKRGGDLERVTLDGILDGIETPDVDALVVDEAMQRLAAVSERKCRVVELRIFGGMSVEETAAAMGIGERMVKRDYNPSWTNPYLDEAAIEEERNRLPERVFRQEFGGQFLEGAGAVFRNVRDSATGSFSEPVPGEQY